MARDSVACRRKYNRGRLPQVENARLHEPKWPVDADREHRRIDRPEPAAELGEEERITGISENGLRLPGSTSQLHRRL